MIAENPGSNGLLQFFHLFPMGMNAARAVKIHLMKQQVAPFKPLGQEFFSAENAINLFIPPTTRRALP